MSTADPHGGVPRRICTTVDSRSNDTAAVFAAVLAGRPLRLNRSFGADPRRPRHRGSTRPSGRLGAVHRPARTADRARVLPSAGYRRGPSLRPFEILTVRLVRGES